MKKCPSRRFSQMDFHVFTTETRKCRQHSSGKTPAIQSRCTSEPVTSDPSVADGRGGRCLCHGGETPASCCSILISPLCCKHFNFSMNFQMVRWVAPKLAKHFRCQPSPLLLVFAKSCRTASQQFHNSENTKRDRSRLATMLSSIIRI